MKVITIIPARMAASRFPGKPLEKILGMPMIGHCYKRSEIAFGRNGVYVATCDNAISDYIKSISGNVIMTSNSHQRATTRTAEALEKIESQINKKIEIIIMVQGDEPLIVPKSISKIVDVFNDRSVHVVNLMTKIRSIEEFLDKNNVKVTVDKKSNALYFSREPIPSPWRGLNNMVMYKQTGIIAFRRESLIHFNSLQESCLEKIESIDMNRVLENSGKIRMMEVEEEMVSVDTPSDLYDAEKIMKNDKFLGEYMEK